MTDVGLCWDNRRVKARRLSGGCKCIFFRRLRWTHNACKSGFGVRGLG